MRRQPEDSTHETIVFNESSKKRKQSFEDAICGNVGFEKRKKPKKIKNSENEEIDEGTTSTKMEENKKNKFSPKTKQKMKPGLNKGQGKFKQGLDKEPKELDKKELRKNQKLLKKKRREKERGYAIPDEAKKIFEELRCKKCPDEKRASLSQELFNILSGKISTAVRSHDLTRMIQWLIKIGPSEIKQKVIDEVIVDTVNLSKTKYANHIILRILKDGDKASRKKILNYLIGNISALCRNRFSVVVVEEYYSKHAKSKEKAYMRQELYSDLFKGGKNPSLTSLSEALSQNPTLTSAILKSTKTILLKLIDKISALKTDLVSDVLYDYLQHCEEQDKLDLLEILKENISVLITSKSGSKIVMHLLWESTAKVKKSIVKELKTQVLKIVKSSGNIFVRSLFDSVDDTVLIKKAILPTILDNAEELVKDTNGRKVLLYLVAHRDPAYFHPKEIEELKKADDSANVKKDISLKEKELLEPCVDCLLLKIKENPQFWFSEAPIAVVAHAVLIKASGEPLFETYAKISEFFTQNMSEEDSTILSDAGIQMVLKKLIKKDPVTLEENKFAVYFSNCLSIDLVGKLVTTNFGCFILVNLIETNIESVFAKIKRLFKKGKFDKILDDQNTKGSEILKNLIQKSN